ncbi:serologically defined colon cancer antigen 8 homolog isoform X2 [Amphiura filiformis]|uniref:serologically defined colon cancer antigen 8 homolog isoform X2 n=1 Tax=Amphiura filiformis TaxID=82378 RepID=UPI003B20E756
MQASDAIGRITDPSDEYKSTVRDRANESLHDLHHTFTSPYPVAAPLKTSSPFPKSTTPRSGMQRQSSYSSEKSAASRLKTLLDHGAIAGSPRTPSGLSPGLPRTPSGLSTGLRAASLPSSRSRIPSYGVMSSPANRSGLPYDANMDMPGPHVEDLLPVINSQSTYIQQLEGENKFCKEELALLKSRLYNVTEENGRLHEELKEAVVKAVLQQEHFTQDLENAAESSADKMLMDKQVFGRFGQELEKMKALHDAKTKRLEGQLSHSREQLDKFEKECDDLRGKLRMAESANLLSREDSIIQDGLCIKCAQYDAVIANTHASPNVKAMERITKERDDLMNTLTTMKTTMDDLKHREADAYEQVKNSINMVEQAQLEKTQALVQKEQVSEDVEKLEQRMTELIAEHQEKLIKERQLTRKECDGQIEQLNQKIAELSQDLVSSQGIVDKVSREKVALMTELEQAKNQIMKHEQEVGQVAQDIKLSTATAKVQRDEAFRQMDRLRHTTEQQVRDKEQEVSRLSKEVRDVRRRLGEAERDATGSKEECIRLTEQLNAVEKEASALRIARDTIEKGKKEEIRSVSRRAKQREEELQQTLYEVENKNSMTVTELEDMMASQNSLLHRLRDEGKVLTGQLDRVSEKYRGEVRRLRHDNAELSSKTERLAIQNSEMEAQVIEHGKTHHKMRSRLQQLEGHAQRSSRQKCD